MMKGGKNINERRNVVSDVRKAFKKVFFGAFGARKSEVTEG